jgi:kynurenine formamidase
MVIDLSHPIFPDMPLWPGTPEPECLPIANIPEDGFAEHSIRLSSHTGTHLDAPAHMIEGGASLDRFEPGSFFGKAAVVDALAITDGVIGLKLLESFEEVIGSSDFVLLHTGWARHWGQPGYDSGYPVLDDDAAEWLCSMGLKGVGIDAPSFDPSGSEAYPVHRRLLRSGLLLLENLANLHLIPLFGCTLAAFPLPVRGVDACPVRAVAILWP